MKTIKASAKQPVLLLVYGTLRKEESNHYLINQKGSKYLGIYKTLPKFTMLSVGNFPVVITKGNTEIICEVYEISDDRILQNIHYLEGCTGIPNHQNNWYDIQKYQTSYGDAYMYVMHDLTKCKHNKIIHTGNWKQHEKN